MKYFNIKRYKFSTVIRSLNNLEKDILNFLKLINFKKIYSYFYSLKRVFGKIIKYFYPSKINIIEVSNKIKIKSNKFLFYHLPISVIFFGFLYLAIPTFYTYDKSKIENIICEKYNVKCVIKGKIKYNFFPSPRLKINDLIINIPSNNITLLTVDKAFLKLSIKNLLAKDKHKYKKTVFINFESNINLKKLKSYTSIFKNKINSNPILLKEGKIILHDNKNYLATINNVILTSKLLEDFSKAKLEGKLAGNNIIINFSKKINDNQLNTDIELKVKAINLFTKISFLNSYTDIKGGKFLIKQNKNKISGIFDYKDDVIRIIKSNTKNIFLDGKLTGKIILLPYFNFNLDLNLNSINFTRLYNHFLSLDNKDRKELFKINNKINGKLNFSAEKVYSKPNLVKSFESRMKFYNGNVKIEQFLFNLGKLGAADLLGRIDNDKESSNFKFESNIFVDDKKKFLSKFGIYNKKNLLSNLFVEGNFDLQNASVSFYEISGSDKFNIEDVNFIETEFNDLMFENNYEDLFSFKKFKVFLKSIRDENN